VTDRGRRLALTDLPPAARAIATAVTDAVAAAGAADADAFADATRRLLLADGEHVRAVLGDAVRLLLEELHPDGLDGDEVRADVVRCVTSSAAWFPDADAEVLVIVLAGALGIHPDPPPDVTAAGWAGGNAAVGQHRPDDPWADAVTAAPPPPAAVARHALALLADLLAARGRPVRPYLEAAFTELARREHEAGP
jgi:hypothetical protein